MQPQASGGKVTFFQWTSEKGLVETVETFTTLDDLFKQCLRSGGQSYVEEVMIAGKDEQGHTRHVTLTFRSVTQPAPITTPR